MVVIKPIEPTPRELKKYVQYGIDLYKGNDCFVPPLIMDEVGTLDPKKNPAFDHCQTKMWMAYDDGRPVGRITAIINRLANEKFGEKTMRFGFVDFIDDKEVVDKLFSAAEEWGREQGMTRAVGPMGFSDMDNEGMLTFGFDELATMAGVYNYPYYPMHMERMGWTKEVDYVEYLLTVPDAIPEKYARVAAIVEKRLDLKVKRFKSRRALKEQYGQAIFDLINEAYAGLYGYVPLTPRQIEHYIDMYLGILRLDTISVIVDKDDKLVCVGISMPSMSQALRKSGGKLFPFGWWPLLKGLKGDHTDIVDLLLVAVKPEYQNKGVNALLFNDLIPSFQAHGFKYAESNVELEGNESVQKQWELFDRRLHKRRRIWQKNL
ncbi:MAG: N-acetyltransferase [Muribaculaceae bacterium]|nr:N-acetyltransferase [Muribaculaceae bacterium]